MSPNKNRIEIEDLEGREALEEESVGSLAPNPELEAAMREAAEAVEARAEARRGGASGGGGDPSDEVEALRAELAATQERMTRLAADLDNLRKRSLKEREEAHRYGHENLVRDLLATVDNLERAIEHASVREGGDLQSVLQGVELVQRELLAALAKHGVTRIEAAGEPFDPSEHEAMAQQEDESVAPNTVVQVFQTGYRLRDRLLRPARVVVSKPPSGDAEKADSGEVGEDA